MLEPFEAAHSVTQLLSRPADELDLGNFKLAVGGTTESLELSWSQVELEVRDQPLAWSADAPLISNSADSS